MKTWNLTKLGRLLRRAADAETHGDSVDGWASSHCDSNTADAVIATYNIWKERGCTLRGLKNIDINNAITRLRKLMYGEPQCR